jgi:hypothetical protein
MLVPGQNRVYVAWNFGISIFRIWNSTKVLVLCLTLENSCFKFSRSRKCTRLHNSYPLRVRFGAVGPMDTGGAHEAEDSVVFDGTTV